MKQAIQFAKQMEVSKDHGKKGPVGPQLRLLYRYVIHQQTSSSGEVERRQQLEERRLATAIPAHHKQNLSPTDAQIQRADTKGLVAIRIDIPKADVLQLDIGKGWWPG